MEVFGSLATIVGLMCNFKSERRAATDDEYKEFIEWLDNKRHKALVNELNSNHILGLSIKSLLEQNHEVVIKKLSELDASLVQLASKISGLKEVASAIAPNVQLSEQAISIIQQFVDSQGSVFLEMKLHGGAMYQVLDGNGGKIFYDEPRFLNDDLEQLCMLGLLTPVQNTKGDRLFRLTRATVQYVAQVSEL